MKSNADKCRLMVHGQRCDDPVAVKIGNAEVVNSSEDQVSKLCQKASNKLYALARICPYMDQNKLRNLTRAFTTNQLQFCGLKGIFHSRQRNPKINKMQGRT